MHRLNLELYLADLLDCVKFKDYCVNGLQVEGRETIEKIVTGVSSSERLFNIAAEIKADTVLVHHGMFWKNSPHPFVLSNIYSKRIKVLVKNDINLLAYHLPLDAHPVLGNNAIIAGKLGLTDVTFSALEDCQNPIAAVGDLPESMSSDAFCKFADSTLDTKGTFIKLTKNPVRRLFVISGGGSSYYKDAYSASADTLVTGELSEHAVRSAEELGLNLYASGHYNSERWGVKALGEHLAENFKIEVVFVDIPNPI